MKLTLLATEQINKIHQASLEILATIGVRIPHQKVLALFQEAGANVNAKTQIVKIPEKLINHSLKVAGKQFTVYGRDHSRKAEFGRGERNYNSSAGQALWVDDSFRRRRYASMEDVKTAARLADGLEQINIVGAMADPQEVPREYRCVAVVAELLKHTTKPITFWFYNRSSAKFILELFDIVAGSGEESAKFPYTYAFLEPISPLKFPKDGVDLLFETSKFPLPVSIGPVAQVGATAPGTLAGTLAQENAEILAGICVVQLIRPGTPICYGGIPHAFDMRTTQMIFAGPEQALMAVAMTQIGKFYGLPVYINVGLTDSKLVDAQAGLEVGITLAGGAMAGADIFGHLGICGVDQGSSLLTLMMQHEVIGYVERMMQGIEVSDETIGIDTIRSVGHEGTFLGEPHTVEHFRRELWFPKLLDRQFWETWVEEGRKDMAQCCRDMKEKILKEHQPIPLDEDTLRKVDKLVEKAKSYLLKQT